MCGRFVVFPWEVELSTSSSEEGIKQSAACFVPRKEENVGFVINVSSSDACNTTVPDLVDKLS